MRPVDADELLKKLLALFNYRIVERDDIKETVDSMPTIEKKHGHWIKDKNNYIYHYICSACGEADKHKSNYCRHCGAKMDEVKK